MALGNSHLPPQAWVVEPLVSTRAAYMSPPSFTALCPPTRAVWTWITRWLVLSPWHIAGLWAIQKLVRYPGAQPSNSGIVLQTSHASLTLWCELAHRMLLQKRMEVYHRDPRGDRPKEQFYINHRKQRNRGSTHIFGHSISRTPRRQYSETMSRDCSSFFTLKMSSLMVSSPEMSSEMVEPIVRLPMLKSLTTLSWTLTCLAQFSLLGAEGDTCQTL